MAYENPKFKPERRYIELTEDDVELETMKSSGPGGQKVNTSDSAVRVRFNVEASPKLTQEQKDLLRERLKLTEGGEYLIKEESERSQPQNRRKAMERLNQNINRALKPKKKRYKTSVPLGEKEQRLKNKKIQSEKKKLRKRPDYY